MLDSTVRFLHWILVLSILTAIPKVSGESYSMRIFERVMAEFCSCGVLQFSTVSVGCAILFARQSYAILSPFLSFLLMAWLLLSPPPASLTQPCRLSPLGSIARRVHLSQLAFRYLSEACWFRHRYKWFEQVC